MINSAHANERQELLGRIAKLEQLTRRIPSRFAGGGAASSVKVLVIIGGNTLAAGVPGIKYSAGPIVPTQVYDPEVDSVYPDGMGRANLYVNGVLQPLRVLVRHNYAAYKAPIIGGSQVTVFGTDSLIYSATTMTLYTFGWGGTG